MLVYIFTGSLAFILFFLFDYYKMRNFAALKNIASLLGLGLFLYSAVMATIHSPKISFLQLVQVVSILPFLLAVALLIYSLFIEIPFKSTYAETACNNSLIDTGTYALCRHPGVIWFFLSFLFLFFTTGATTVFVAAIVWTSIDILYVFLQEKLFFCSMFPGYDNYQKTTPMLIPNICSIRRCLRTFDLKGGYIDEKLR